ncbi:Nramp family divalent metal transporter [Tautonia marina]|uniref:Nramp family divalent metal transporter n=1 Tax=Tautonia marina TaxID=2653855 RepID=UPI001260FA72|nr:Nramp family divalent metal transporter [Tautonia marina]
MTSSGRPSLLPLIGPGLLVAATGVGAGDLLTASYAGSKAGMALVWAVVIGCVFKWALTEGLARWQMATGTTLLEGWATKLGGWIRWVFLAYLLLWSLITGGSLGKACGVAGDGLFPLGDRATSQAIWTVVHALGGLFLVWVGGFKTFERIMAVLVASMFVCVILAAALLGPDFEAIARGLTRPTIRSGDLPYAVGLLGGVGGTVTLLSYGYWIRESNRSGLEGAKLCRIDLAIAYAATGLFGIAMLVISSRITVDRQGAEVALLLADQLQEAAGPVARLVFLVGFWGAVFSSLLGVWQSAPYLFADFRQLSKGDTDAIVDVDLDQTRAYRGYLVAIAVVPLVLIQLSVRHVQLAHAVLGALFMPLLAVTLLILNNREDWVGRSFRNRWGSNLLLILTLVTFAGIGIADLLSRFGGGAAGPP